MTRQYLTLYHSPCKSWGRALGSQGAVSVTQFESGLALENEIQCFTSRYRSEGGPSRAPVVTESPGGTRASTLAPPCLGTASGRTDSLVQNCNAFRPSMSGGDRGSILTGSTGYNLYTIDEVDVGLGSRKMPLLREPYLCRSERHLDRNYGLSSCPSDGRSERELEIPRRIPGELEAHGQTFPGARCRSTVSSHGDAENGEDSKPNRKRRLSVTELVEKAGRNMNLDTASVPLKKFKQGHPKDASSKSSHFYDEEEAIYDRMTPISDSPLSESTQSVIFENPSATAEARRPYRCAECKSSFSTAGKLGVHGNLFHRGAPKCTAVSPGSRNTGRLLRHIRSQHPNRIDRDGNVDWPETCPICERKPDNYVAGWGLKTHCPLCPLRTGERTSKRTVKPTNTAVKIDAPPDCYSEQRSSDARVLADPSTAGVMITDRKLPAPIPNSASLARRCFYPNNSLGNLNNSIFSSTTVPPLSQPLEQRRLSATEPRNEYALPPSSSCSLPEVAELFKTAAEGFMHRFVRERRKTL